MAQNVKWVVSHLLAKFEVSTAQPRLSPHDAAMQAQFYSMLIDSLLPRLRSFAAWRSHAKQTCLDGFAINTNGSSSSLDHN
jgi:hypothetical protein